MSWQHVEQTFLATGLPGQEVLKDTIEKNDRFEVAVYLFFRVSGGTMHQGGRAGMI